MRKIITTLALAAAVPACAYDASGVDPDATPLRTALGKRAFLDLGTDSRVGVTAIGPDGKVMQNVAPDVTGGRAVLRSTEDGFLIVEDLDVKLADVTVPPMTFGQPIHLTDVRLRLGTQIDEDGDWAPSGTYVTGEGKADLLLDWSWALDNGTIYPLATQKLSGALFETAVRMDDAGNLRADVWMTQPGEVKRIADTVTLSDLSMAVVAATPLP
jgi:hypothetical protein